MTPYDLFHLFLSSLSPYFYLFMELLRGVDNKLSLSPDPFSSFVLFYFLLQSGESVESARNIILLLMVLFENVHVFNARTEINYLHHIGYKSSMFLIYWVIFTQLLHIACMHIPFMQNILSTQPVSLDAWLALAIIAIGLVIVMEADKWIMLRKEKLSTQL